MLPIALVSSVYSLRFASFARFARNKTDLLCFISLSSCQSSVLGSKIKGE